MSTVKLVNLNKIYPNGVQAVYDFNLEIHDKEFIAFVGPSGCGKTTTLRMIAGLEEITSGMLFIDDKLYNDVAPKDRHIAMVFQSYALYPHKNVFGNMAFGLKMRKIPVPKLDKNGNPIYKIDKKSIKKYQKQLKLFQTQLEIAKVNNPSSVEEVERNIASTLEKINYYTTTPVALQKYVHRPKKEIEERVFQAAKILQLENYLDRKPSELSGGQRQRVALGRAIVRNAKVFLMDEPLSNLDAKLRVQMRTEIIKLHRQMGSITIYVTHDQTEAMTMATRIVVMNNGHIQQIGTPKEIYNHPVNKFVASFIGSPAMNFVYASFDGEKIVMGETSVELSKDQIETLKNASCPKDVLLGIRPEAINLVANPSGKAEVGIIETLGSEFLVHFNLEDGKTLCAKTMSDKDLLVGSKIDFTVDVEKLHVFDKESEVAYF